MGNRTLTRWLLAGGVIGPVVFVVVFLVEGWTRPGYDPMHMFVSVLSLGDAGWRQVANFVVSGVLVTAGAQGLRRVLTDGPGATWGPILVYLAGIGMIGAGLFTTDPVQGFPPGTRIPAGRLDSYSAGAMVHQLASSLVFIGLPIAMFVMARRFRGEGSRWEVYCQASAVGVLVFLFAAFIVTDLTGLLQRVAIVLALGWVAQVCWRYWREAAG